MIDQKDFFDADFSVRISKDLIEFFKIATNKQHCKFFRRLIVDFFDKCKDTNIKEVNKMYKNFEKIFYTFFDDQTKKMFLNGTYYNFNKKDCELRFKLFPRYRKLVVDYCKGKNISITIFIEGLYFNYLKKLSENDNKYFKKLKTTLIKNFEQEEIKNFTNKQVKKMLEEINNKTYKVDKTKMLLKYGLQTEIITKNGEKYEQLKFKIC